MPLLGTIGTTNAVVGGISLLG